MKGSPDAPPPPRQARRVVVTGGRDFKDRRFVRHKLDSYHAEYGISALAQGLARGVDRFARDWAEDRGVPFVDYAADWDRYGDAAGSIRNEEMLDDFRPDDVLVFPGGVGTADCARKARKKGYSRTFFNLTDDPFEDARNWG